MSLRSWFKKRPSWFRKLALLIGAFLLSAVILGGVCIGLITYAFSRRDMCGSHGSDEFVSPDGKYRAVVYEYDCGATTDFGTNLAILGAHQKFDPYAVKGDAHVLAADSNHNAVSVNEIGILPVEVSWQDATHLAVTLPSEARIFLKKTTSGPITIEYLIRN